jgi:hypothetical protein
MRHAGRLFEQYLSAHAGENSREFLLPGMVGSLIKSGEVTVRVLSSADKWFGVTYASDKPRVVAEIQAMRERGIYPPTLWKE